MIVCLAVFGVFQLFFITEVFDVKSSTMRRVAPWFHDSFLRIVGEHPSNRPAISEQTDPESEVSTASGMATVAGFNPEELEVTLDNMENPVMEETAPAEQKNAVIPVSQPEKPDEPVDENIPVG